MIARASSSDRLAEIVEAFAGKRVVVLGDLVCDEFVHGDIARVSREAPVLILEQDRIELVPGGGANAVANLRALGADPRPVGIVGADPSGEGLVDLLRTSSVDVAGIRPERAYGTPTKSRILAGGVHTRRQQIVRIDRGARHGSLGPKAMDGIRSRLRRALRGAHGVLVADYGYGAATPSLVRGLRARIRADLPVTVDSRGRVASYRDVWACTPNQEEAEHALAVGALSRDRDVDAAGRALLRRTRNRAVLITRGARGMSLYERGASPTHLPAFGAGEVADVTGAGDTVIAAFTLALIAGATFPEAATLANCAAGLVVMKYGTATVAPDELVAAVRAGLS